MSRIGERHHPGIDAAWAFYKRVVSPLLHALSPHGGGCLYQPTCSEYAALACAQHGVGRGGWMAAWRLLRCNPLSRGGWDPVPLSPHYRDKRLTRSQVP